jgi:hypothetical protein
MHHERLKVEFSDAIEILEEHAQDRDAHNEDIAYDEYIRTVVLGNFEAEDGQFSFDLRDNAIEGIRQKYGDAMLNYIQERRSVTTPTLLKELFEGRERLSPYWGAPETILQEANMGVLLPQLQEYLKANAEERALIIEEFPMLRGVVTATTRVRQQLREESANIDAFLLRWGYGGRLHNEANKQRDLDELIRTPVRFR